MTDTEKTKPKAPTNQAKSSTNTGGIFGSPWDAAPLDTPTKTLTFTGVAEATEATRRWGQDRELQTVERLIPLLSRWLPDKPQADIINAMKHHLHQEDTPTILQACTEAE